MRTPKVYNALITTDQNLTPSRAYPVIQPTVHETPFVYPPYLYNGIPPFGLYDPYTPFIGGIPDVFARFNYAGAQKGVVAASSGPAVSGNPGAEVSGRRNFEQQASAATRGTSDGRQASELVNAIHATNFARQDDNSLIHQSREKSPVPLNEFGFPPSLIPLSNYNGIQRNPINLAPYNLNNFNSFPLLIDQFGGFQQGPYLPPFAYFPDTPYAPFGGNKDSDRNPNNDPNVGFAGAGAGANSAGKNIPSTQNADPNASGNNDNGISSNSNEGVAGGGADGSSASAAGAEAAAAAAAAAAAEADGDASSQNTESSDQSKNTAASNQINFSRNGDAANGSGGSRSSSQSSQSQASSSFQTPQGFSQNARNGRVFYFGDNIKNNKNRDANIVDVSPPPIPFRIKDGSNEK